MHFRKCFQQRLKKLKWSKFHQNHVVRVVHTFFSCCSWPFFLRCCFFEELRPFVLYFGSNFFLESVCWQKEEETGWIVIVLYCLLNLSYPYYQWKTIDSYKQTGYIQPYTSYFCCNFFTLKILVLLKFATTAQCCKNTHSTCK